MCAVRFDIRNAKASTPPDGFTPNPKLKLLDQVSEVMRFKHYSLRLPTVLMRPEVDRILNVMTRTHQLMAKLLYRTGMRLMECVRLRVKDVDFEKNQIIVREGKGFKDRATVIPGALKERLAEHLQRVKILHEKDPNIVPL